MSIGNQLDFCAFLLHAHAIELHATPDKRTALFAAPDLLHSQGVIAPAPETERFHGYYYNYITVPKPNHSVLPILDFKR